MCNFPAIQYDPKFEGLRNQKIPQGTYTYLKKNGIANGLSLDGIASMVQLENRINGLITAYTGDDNDLYIIFRLIQIWGGNYGKRVFIENPDFENRWNSVIRDKYRGLVNVCTAIKANANSVLGISGDDVDKTFNAICGILNAREGKKKAVPGFGVAFITKHTRFWLQQNNFNNPLPIFDSVMSWGLFNRENADISRLKCYWKCMIKKTKSLNNGMTLLALERQLFNYFSGVDERKKNNNQEGKCRTLDYPTSSLYKMKSKDGGHYVFEEEKLAFRGISILLILCRTSSGKSHFCGFWNKDVPNTNIDSISEIQDIINELSLSSLKWQNKPEYSRKYVMYTSKDSYNKAKELKDKISQFIHKMNK